MLPAHHPASDGRHRVGARGPRLG